MMVFTFIVVIISSLPIVSLGMLTSDSKPIRWSPCVEDRDPVYDGIRVNCQNKGISFLPLPAHWIPMETSSLLLDYNSLVYLNQTSFSAFPAWARLRLLGLSHNSISHIEPCTFSKFVSLKQLYLDNNVINLDANFFSGREFEGLGSLSELKLTQNNNWIKKGNFSNSLLSHLHNLESLALDTFEEELTFSKQFHIPKRLSSLLLSGGMTRIRNESLEGFSSINLTKLCIHHCDNLQHTETGAFEHLEHLQWYEVIDVGQGPRNTLESLAPFINRNMSHLTFRNLYYDRAQTTPFKGNSVLSVHIGRYLSQICVENFALAASGIFVIERDVFVNPTWNKCLRTLDLSLNPLQGEVRSFAYLMPTMQRLEEVNMMNVKYSFRSRRGRVWQPPSCQCKAKSSAFGALSTFEEIGAQSVRHHDNNERGESRHQISEISRTFSPVSSDLSETSFSKAKTNTQDGRRQKHKPALGVIKYYFPKRLRILNLNSVADYFLRFDEHAQFVNGDEVEEMHLSDDGVRKFTGSYSGLTKLKLLDISTNIGSLMSPTFFNGFSSLLHLNMAEMKLDYTFMGEHSRELFGSMIYLTTLDLSKNELLVLSKGTFDANNDLRVLLLSGNRFESVPFDLSQVPHLCWLDLSGNALRGLSEHERTELDTRVNKVQTFSLSLNGNPIHCGCQSIRFLSWLERTQIYLDNQGNYSCTLDSGIMTSTGQIQDLNAMWRKCIGKTSLFISIVMCCLMISGFFLFIVTFKFKTQLKAFLLRKFWPPFIAKTPADYAIGVYIGYADQDMNLACHRLRQFIEKRLGLSTYVRHRDLLPASDMAEAIVEAVHSSWRVLFVVSDHFLADLWSYFALKASTYAAQFENPGRIVLIMIDGDNNNECLLSKLPTSVLRVVQKQSIVTMTSRGQISYEDKQALITALLHQGSFFDD